MSIISRLSVPSGPSRRDNRKSRYMGNQNKGRYSHGKSLSFNTKEVIAIALMVACYDRNAEIGNHMHYR